MDHSNQPWRVWLAWAVILGACLFTVSRHQTAPPEPAGQDTVGLILVQLQSKYLVGAARLMPVNSTALYAQAEGLLNIGTVGQRQRFVIVSAEMAGPAEARLRLEQLDKLIDAPPFGGPVEVSESQAKTQEILHKLYPSQLNDLDDDEARRFAAEAAASLGPTDRAALSDDLQWFAELALSPRDSQQRADTLRTASIVAGLFIGVAVLAVMAGVLGLIVLILLIVFTLMGRFRSGLGPAGGAHVIYAETFAVWLVLFFGLQQLTSIAPAGWNMLAVTGCFFGSLGALVWPVVRGVPWSVVT